MMDENQYPPPEVNVCEARAAQLRVVDRILFKAGIGIAAIAFGALAALLSLGYR